MADVKVPALLHKMSKAAQKAWYKKNNMTMPSEVEGGGRSAAAAKRVVAPAPRKQMAAAPQSVRAMNTARQQAYYAKGGRQPIGAGGSGGHSSMAGVGQSSAKEIIKGIKAGYNPKVALVRYTNEEAEQVDEAKAKMTVKTDPKLSQLWGRHAAHNSDWDSAHQEYEEGVPDRGPKGTAIYNTVKEKYGTRMANRMARHSDAWHEANHFKRYASHKQLSNMRNNAGISDQEFSKGLHRANGTRLSDYLDESLVVNSQEVEQVDEVTKKEAEETLGGPVKTKPKMPPGKQPEGYRYVRALARRAMKAGLKKEEVEQVDEAAKGPLHVVHVSFTNLYADRLYEPHRSTMNYKVHAPDKEAAKRYAERDLRHKSRPGLKAHSARLVKEEAEQVDEARRMSAAEKLGRAFDSEQQRSALSRQRGLDLLKQKDTEKMQNKPASGNMTKLKKEETEESTMKYIEEKLTAADPASKWISDFVKSDNPKFAGKSKKERIQQALGAYYAKKRGTNEEVEQVDEGRLRRSMRGYAVLGGYGYGNKVRYQSAGERSREINVGLDDKQEKENARRAAEADKAKMKKEEVEQMDELRASTYASASNKRQAQAGTAAKVGANHASRVLQDKSDKLAYSAAMTGQREFLKTLSPATKRVMSKEEIVLEEPKDAADVGEYDYEGDMAMSQLRSILANAKRLHDMLEENTNLPEWVQSKITLAEDYVVTAANYMESEMNEEIEQVDELKKSTLASYIGKAAGRLSASSRLQRDFEKDGHTEIAGEFQRQARKKRSGIEKAANKLAKEEAEGKVAVTPKEKSLAAHHGDKTKITYGDVIKARLKSAAAKKMGK
jgi:hypothetical protein